MTSSLKKVSELMDDFVMNSKEKPKNASGEWRHSYALANCYRDHSDSVGAHSDRLSTIGPAPIVASLSLGAARTFVVKHLESQKSYHILLEHNSLLIMWHPMQTEYRHGIPQVKVEDIKHQDNFIPSSSRPYLITHPI